MSLDRKRDERVLDLLIEHAPPVVDAYFNPRSRWPSLCVLSTRVGIDVLDYFGVEAEPQPVAVTVGNATWWEVAARISNGWRPTEEELDGSGARYVQVDTEGPGRIQKDGSRGWPGHLVISLRKWSDTLVDLDIGQFYRPQKSIVVPRAVALGVGPEFWSGKAASFLFEEGTGAVYEQLVPSRSFREGADWKRKNPITGKVIRRIREELDR